MLGTAKDHAKLDNFTTSHRTYFSHFSFSTPTNSQLLKYFPKYLHNITIEQHDYRTITKLKRIKIIHKATHSTSRSMTKLALRSFLVTKAKSVKRYFRLSHPKEIIEAIRLYPFMKELDISKPLSSSRNHPNIVKKEFYRIGRFFEALPQLESLDILFDRKESLCLLQALDLNKSLKDLKHFKIRFSWRDSSDQKILTSLLEMKNVLKYVTCLDLGRLASDGFESFKRLPEKCQSLQQISLIIGNSDYFWDIEGVLAFGEPYQETLSYLQTLEIFQKLERVDIEVQDLVPFVRDFTLPACTKHVRLDLSDCQWDSDEEFSIESPMFIRFFERWAKLTNLESLEIESYESEYMNFCQELLKRAPQVRKLKRAPV